MELLILGPEVGQYFNGLLNVRGFHHNLLETAVKGAVLFHYLGELVNCCGANALELSAGQGRFEHVCGIQASGCTAGAHNGVELVYEKYKVRILPRFLDNGLEPLLEVSAILCSGHNRSNVQGHDPLLGKCRRNIPGGYPEGDSLHNCRFANAGLAYEHGVVLLAAAKNLYHAYNLRVTANHRVKFTLLGGTGEVVCELLYIQLLAFLRVLFRALGRLAVCRGLLARLGLWPKEALVLKVRQEAAVVNAVGAEVHLAIALRYTAKGQQKVLRHCRRALEAGCLHHGYIQDILGLTGKTDVVQLLVRDGFVGEYTAIYECLELCGLHTQITYCGKGGILLLPYDSKKQMVRANSVASGTHGFFPGIFDDGVEVV